MNSNPVPVLTMLLLSVWLIGGCQVAPPDGSPAGAGEPEPREGTGERQRRPGVAAAEQLREEALQSLNAGDTVRASVQLERAIRIDPDAADGYFHLARVRILEGLYEEARQLLLQARTLLDSQGVRSGDLLSGIDRLLEQLPRMQMR